MSSSRRCRPAQITLLKRLAFLLRFVILRRTDLFCKSSDNPFVLMVNTPVESHTALSNRQWYGHAACQRALTTVSIDRTALSVPHERVNDAITWIGLAQ